MAIEMCAFRSLQTNFGSSIYVTGILLTLVMLALATGYFMGGRSSSIDSEVKIPFILIFVSLYILFVGILMDSWILDQTFEMRKLYDDPRLVNLIPPAIATFFLHAIPMFGLSHLSPMLIHRLEKNSKLNSSEKSVGISSGTILCVSTVGSIVGTLAASYLFIPEIGVSNTLWIVSTSGVFIALAEFICINKIKFASVSALIFISQIVVWSNYSSAADLSVVHEKETAYGKIIIRKAKDSEGYEKLIFEPSRTYIHSEVFPSAPLRDYFVTGYLTHGLVANATNYGILGVAGGGALLQLKVFDKTAKMTGVEIDSDSIEIAKKYFNVIVDEKTKLVAEDARVYLKSTKIEHDYLIVDLFSGEYIPPHCVTTEFFKLAFNNLSEDGILFINSNMEKVVSPINFESKVDAPIDNLLSSLFNAGFKSIFMDDWFGYGFIYAYKNEINENKILERMWDKINDIKLDPHLRASLAIGYLRIREMEVRQTKPFKDTWIPENLIQLKSNKIELHKEIWEQAMFNIKEPKHDVWSLLEYFKFLNWKGKLSEEEFNLKYCETMLSYKKEHIMTRHEFSKYFKPDYCFDIIDTPAFKIEDELLGNYIRGYKLFKNYEPERALPYLVESILYFRNHNT